MATDEEKDERSEVRKFFQASGRPETAPATIGDVIAVVEHLAGAGKGGTVNTEGASGAAASTPAKPHPRKR